MNNDLIISKQLDWHKKASQGCYFAAILATDVQAEISGFVRLIYPDQLDEELIKKLSKDVSNAIQNPTITILSIVIPSINSTDDLIKFIELIKSNTEWNVDDSETYDGFRLVKIRISLGCEDENGDDIMSWALIFAPLNHFPITRQSPFFEYCLSVKSRYFLMQKYDKLSLTQHKVDTENRGGAKYDAHLADIYIKGITDNGRRDTRKWDDTKKRKRELLTNQGQIPFDDTRAKAKITCSYPIL